MSDVEVERIARLMLSDIDFFEKLDHLKGKHTTIHTEFLVGLALGYELGKYAHE